MIILALSMVGLSRKPLSSATSSPWRSGGTASHQRCMATVLLVFMSAEILATVGFGASALVLPMKLPEAFDHTLAPSTEVQKLSAVMISGFSLPATETTIGP